MSRIRGSIMNDALLGLLITGMITGVIMSASQLKHQLIFETDCKEMKSLWQDTELLDACFPKKETVIEGLLETGGEVVAGELPLNPDIPLLN